MSLWSALYVCSRLWVIRNNPRILYRCTYNRIYILGVKARGRSLTASVQRLTLTCTGKSWNPMKSWFYVSWVCNLQNPPWKHPESHAKSSHTAALLPRSFSHHSHTRIPFIYAHVAGRTLAEPLAHGYRKDRTAVFV